MLPDKRSSAVIMETRKTDRSNPVRASQMAEERHAVDAKMQQASLCGRPSDGGISFPPPCAAACAVWRTTACAPFPGMATGWGIQPSLALAAISKTALGRSPASTCPAACRVRRAMAVSRETALMAPLGGGYAAAALPGAGGRLRCFVPARQSDARGGLSTPTELCFDSPCL